MKWLNQIHFRSRFYMTYKHFDQNNAPRIGMDDRNRGACMFLNGSGPNASSQLNTHGVRIIVKVDQLTHDAQQAGLSYFALQVNFPNGTWAHGGLQVDAHGKYLNWGGLVDHGGGNKDYTDADPEKDILLIQNAPDTERESAFNWDVNQPYVLSIRRGELHTFPPGTYKVIGGQPSVTTKVTRKLYEWIFEISLPAKEDTPLKSVVLYNSAETIRQALFWNELQIPEDQTQARMGIHTLWTEPGEMKVFDPDSPEGWIEVMDLDVP
jgi:hypothetical protein